MFPWSEIRRGVLTKICFGGYFRRPSHHAAVAWLSIAPGPA